MKKVLKKWGHEKWIVNKSYCGKRLFIRKGWRSSIHFHKEKDETFYLESGKLLFEFGKRRLTLRKGDSIYIRPGMSHRFSGIESSVLFEFSTHHLEKDSFRDPEALSGRISK